MPLHVPYGLNTSFRYDNWGSPTPHPTTVGTTVTPGTSGSEGSWTQLASSSNISQDCYGFALWIGANAVSGQLKSFLADIGIDPAGGTSYVETISNLNVCNAADYAAAGGYSFLFPLFVKAGSSLAIRIQGSHATPTDSRVSIELYGRAKWPDSFPVGSFCETIGTPASSAGQSFTPGNAAYGSWTSLGTTSKDIWWWQFGPSQGLSTNAQESTFVELAFGDGTNNHVIQREIIIPTTVEQVATYYASNLNLFECFCPVPAGSNIYVRGKCNNSPNSGYTALAYGIGG